MDPSSGTDPGPLPNSTPIKVVGLAVLKVTPVWKSPEAHCWVSGCASPVVPNSRVCMIPLAVRPARVQHPRSFDKHCAVPHHRSKDISIKRTLHLRGVACLSCLSGCLSEDEHLLPSSDAHEPPGHCGPSAPVSAVLAHRTSLTPTRRRGFEVCLLAHNTRPGTRPQCITARRRSTVVTGCVVQTASLCHVRLLGVAHHPTLLEDCSPRCRQHLGPAIARPWL